MKERGTKIHTYIYIEREKVLELLPRILDRRNPSLAIMRDIPSPPFAINTIFTGRGV